MRRPLERMRRGGARVASFALAGVLTVGLMPLPAFAADLQAADGTITPQADAASIEGSVIGAAFAAAEPAPEILGLNGPEYRGTDDMTTQYKIFGTTDNTNPDPFLVNWNGGVNSTSPSIMPGSRAGGPMAAAAKYKGDGSSSDQIWDLLPDVIIGTGSDTQPKDEATMYDSVDYARAVETANKLPANSYHPIGVTYNRVDLNAMIGTMYRIAAAADSVVETTKGAKQLRYGSATDIAKNYERYITGTKGYVKMQIDAGKVEQKTVANIQSYDATAKAYTIIPDGQAEGTATQNRFLEAVQGVTYNYYDTCASPVTTSGDSSTKTVTADELKKDVDVILVGGQGGAGSSTAVTDALSADGLLDRTFYCTNMNSGSVFGVTVNSVENAQNVGRILPCVYSELLDQSDFVAYYYDVFYHIKDSERSRVIDERMDGVRNWANTESSAYLDWKAADVSDYSRAEVQGIIQQGLYYMNDLAADQDAVYNKVLKPTDNLKDETLASDEATPADYQAIDLGKYASIEVENKVYTGEALTPEPVVKVGQVTLKKDVDYTVSYADNTGSASELSTAKVTVTAKEGSAYAGSKAGEFKIGPDVTASITVGDVADQTFTGSAIEPALVVKEGDKVLEEGKDYKVVFSNNKYVSDSPAYTVTGTGNYIFSKEGTFTIVGADLKDVVVAEIADQAYTGSAVEPALDVTFGEYSLNSSDYTAAFSDNTAVGTATVTLTATSNGNFKESTTAQATFSIKYDLSTAAIAAIADQEYTGEAIKPVPEVTLDGKAVDAANYEVAYDYGTVGRVANKVAVVGTPVTVSVTGAGDYMGTAETTFNVTAIDLSKASATPAQASVTYTGAALKPAVTVTSAAGKAIPASDLSAAYTNNVNAGTASIEVTPATGNVTGSASATFTIGKASQTVTAKKKTVKVKLSKLRKKKQTVKAATVAKGNSASTPITYKLVKANKKKAKFSVASNGKITVKKGLKKGTYKLTIAANAAASGNYNAASSKFVVTVKVK